MTLLLALLLCGPPKAEAVVIPAQVKEYFPVVIEATGFTSSVQGAIDITPEPVWRDDVSPSKVRFTGPPGIYHVEVLLIDFDAKRYVKKRGDVEIVGSAPKPPPEPTPPPVTDPDFAKIKAAYDSDTPVDGGLRKLNAAALVKYYRDAAAACNASKAQTVKTFFEEIEAKADEETVGLGLPKTRAIVSPQLSAVFGGSQADGRLPVTDYQRKSLGAVFTKYATLIEQAAR